MKPRFIVVGAGISGLALGWFLKKQFGNEISLNILEASARPGGWIRTSDCNGFLFEEGPRSCRTQGSGTDTLELVEALGLQDEVIAAAPHAKKRFIYTKGQLRPVPRRFLSWLFLPGILPALWREWRIPPGTGEDESIADFISRRFGKEIAENWIDPLVSGIYAGDIRRLSLQSCFPFLHTLEQRHGSIIKGMLAGKTKKTSGSPFVQAMKRVPIFSFKRGMETLIHTLHDQLREELTLSCKVDSLRAEKDKIVLMTDKGRFEADRVFLAAPAKEDAPFFGVGHVKAATVAVVNLGWQNRILKREGFGYLVPSSEREKILGVVWDSSVFPEQNRKAQTRLTVMLGGTRHPEVKTLSKEEIGREAIDALDRHLHICHPPDAMHVVIAKQAIPQYEVGHHERLKKMEETVAAISSGRVYLAGSAWHGVSVNDCIAHAKKIAADAKRTGSPSATG